MDLFAADYDIQRHEVVLVIPRFYRDYFDYSIRRWRWLHGEERLKGLTIFSTDAFRSYHVAVFRLADILAGRTPGSRRIIIHEGKGRRQGVPNWRRRKTRSLTR